MYTCPKCEREILSKGGLTQHLKFCKGKRVCANPDCNNFIKPSNQYCSNRCAALVTSPGRTPSTETRQKISCTLGGSGELRSLGNGKCISCGKNTKNQKFCNNSCQQRYYFDQDVKKWLNGEIDGSSKGGHAGFVRRYLFEKYNNKCSRCGWGETNPFTKRIPLEVEHIDGNAYNNHPTNVTLLCPNCQGLTSTYKGANKGNGRRSYMKKYYIRDEHDKIIRGS